MALGTNYKRQNDRDDKSIKHNLNRHEKLTKEFIAKGLSPEEASRRAFNIICGRK